MVVHKFILLCFNIFIRLQNCKIAMQGKNLLIKLLTFTAQIFYLESSYHLKGIYEHAPFKSTTNCHNLAQLYSAYCIVSGNTNARHYQTTLFRVE